VRVILVSYRYLLGLFKIIKAAITPGIQPQTVSIKTISTEPQPLPITARGGKRIASSTRHKLIKTKLQFIFLIFRLSYFGIWNLEFGTCLPKARQAGLEFGNSLPEARQAGLDFGFWILEFILKTPFSISYFNSLSLQPYF
tara:strand:- start:55 stop:477 length:423 start_codon:yes stop_codon:yes gene_type:complete